MILGFDPGKDKCGIAVMGRDRNICYHQVVLSEAAISTIQSLCEQFSIELLVLGDQTTSKSWKQKLTQSLSPSIKIVQVDERYSSLEARERYWQMYPSDGTFSLDSRGNADAAETSGRYCGDRPN